MTLPVLMGYIPLGIVYGFLATQAGYLWWQPILLSVTAYGGASQYMLVPLMAANASLATITVACVVINIRHLFYGISLLDRVAPSGWRRWCTAFWLTDETYSLLTMLPRGNSPLAVRIAALDYSYWIAGTAIGSIAGARFQVGIAGMDFCLTALFAVLACEQWRARTTSWPLWAALAGFGLARWLLPTQSLTCGIVFCTAVGLLWHFRNAKKEA